MRIDFGPGCDSDTLDAVLGALVGYIVAINGGDYAIKRTGVNEEGLWALIVRRYEDGGPDGIGDEIAITDDEIDTLHIY
jgi:hypothetical protein